MQRNILQVFISILCMHPCLYGYFATIFATLLGYITLLHLLSLCCIYFATFTLLHLLHLLCYIYFATFTLLHLLHLLCYICLTTFTLLYLLRYIHFDRFTLLHLPRYIHFATFASFTLLHLFWYNKQSRCYPTNSLNLPTKLNSQVCPAENVSLPNSFPNYI